MRRRARANEAAHIAHPIEPMHLRTNGSAACHNNRQCSQALLMASVNSRVCRLRSECRRIRLSLAARCAQLFTLFMIIYICRWLVSAASRRIADSIVKFIDRLNFEWLSVTLRAALSVETARTEFARSVFARAVSTKSAFHINGKQFYGAESESIQFIIY